MKKRIGSGYLLSLILPAFALAILMLKVFGSASRWVAFGFYLAGWLGLVLAIRAHARVRRKVSRGKLGLKKWWSGYWRHVLAGSGLAALGAVLWVLVPVDAAVFVKQDAEGVAHRVAVDRERLLRAGQGLSKAQAECVGLLARGVSTDAHRKRELLAAWARYLDYALELDTLLETHKYFYQLNGQGRPGVAARSFLVGFAALVTQLEGALSLSDAVGSNANAETLLNEPNESFGVGADTYFRLRQGLTRADNLLRLQAGQAYAQLLLTRAKAVPADRALLKTVRQRAKALGVALGRQPAVFIDNPLDYFERTAFKAWFPLQKGVAVAVSDIRTTRRENLMSPRDIQTLKRKLEPMDILLERRNWYLTNIGLPGFWPHAALFVGTPEELDAYFDEAARAATEGHAPSDYLVQRFPKAFAALAGRDAAGHAHRVIEAIGEGVVIASLEHSAHADYVAALRPRLHKRDKLAGLVAALSHYNKPYDYDFDFVTDKSIVCSELVFKALQPAPGRAGLKFTLVETSGRLVLPPNDIAKKYALEADSEIRDLDFVAYFEGSEAERGVAERSDSHFRQTWKRPKWDIVQP